MPRIPVIKFSHRYKKMPAGVTTFCESFVCNVEVKHYTDLTPEFIKQDTEYDGGFYELPKAKLLIITIFTEGVKWTTVRRWTEDKEKYYRGLLGKEVHINIEEDK